MNVEHVPDPIVSEEKPASEKQPGVYHFAIDVVETLIISIALFLGINFVTARIRVDGTSMEPTLHNDEFVLVNKLAYQYGKPKTGDIIVFHFPGDPEQEYIKRVIGVPGDIIEVNGGRVYRNGQLLTEPYIAAMPKYEGTWSVPESDLFVLGDNRNNSSDSHSWGPVPMNYVVGKAMVIYWPPEHWGAIAHTASAAP
jgi:signal peptidase I